MSSGSSPGPPVRIFTEASVRSTAKTRVAAISLRLGERTRSHAPGATCSTMTRKAALRSPGSVISTARPRMTAERKFIEKCMAERA